MSLGCMLVHPCGCSLLNGRPYKRCDRHAAEGGALTPNLEQDAWLKRQQEKRTFENGLSTEQLLERRA